ncbi:MAG: mannose-6-phosphate isomerase, class I [Desulfobacterales bacterium]|jgi:mannose-6-phosphate isomerase
MAGICFLKNSIQEYAWGSTQSIPKLLGRPNTENRPQAELWMGAHPKAPSLARHKGRWVSLQHLISQDPEGILGKTVAKKFNNRLPFLFKVLAAAKPLSIQAHPNRQQAQKGFQRENEQKILLDAVERNYRDDYHKPECICALTRFWALSRFRRIASIITDLQQLNLTPLNDMLTKLKQHPTPQGLKRFYTSLMSLSQDQNKRVVGEALKKARQDTADGPEFQWMIKLASHYPEDIGVLSPFFLNLICLEPGQAIYLDAGELHAYLEGLGIELMANSDNVLRGGLTPKHVDVPELLRILNFEGRDITLLTPQASGANELIYPSPAAEFVLSVITLSAGDGYQSPSRRNVEIIICTQGNLTIAEHDSQVEIALPQGTSALIPASVTRYGLKGEGVCYKAGVPLSVEHDRSTES